MYHDRVGGEGGFLENTIRMNLLKGLRLGFEEICVDFWDFRRGVPEPPFLLLLINKETKMNLEQQHYSHQTPAIGLPPVSRQVTEHMHGSLYRLCSDQDHIDRETLSTTAISRSGAVRQSLLRRGGAHEPPSDSDRPHRRRRRARDRLLNHSMAKAFTRLPNRRGLRQPQRRHLLRQARARVALSDSLN